MSLPFILDVGIGLIFVYLTLSLLASELQELLTTLLQWRARHLRQSIETLLAGENNTLSDLSSPEEQAIQAQIDQSKALAKDLYSHPLVRSANQEAKGLLGKLGRMVSQFTQTSKVFAGRSSGPSYLPSETFSSTLLETLRTEDLMQKLSESKLTKTLDSRLFTPVLDVVSDLRNGKANNILLEHEFKKFEADLRGIIQSFSNHEVTLSNSLTQSSSVLRRFTASAEATLPENDHLSKVFLKRLGVIEQEMPGLLQEAGAGAVEVVSELTNMAWAAQLLQKYGGDYQAIAARLQDDPVRQRFQTGYARLQTMNQVTKEAGRAKEAYQTTLTKLSPYLQESLVMLAKRAETKTQTQINAVEQGSNALRQEVALWFDRSMDRASGVYKRNAKGVALAIGFLIAVTTNTDTLHMIEKLTKDPSLRATYTQAASELIGSSPEAIGCMETAQDKAMQSTCLQNGGVSANAANLRQAIDNTTALPIGWSAANWREQWQPDTQGAVVSGFKVFGGWLVSAIAISMGAPFWFSLLNKVINVRNSGKPPASTSQAQPPG